MNDLLTEKNKNFSNTENCSIRLVLDRIGEKWSILILLILQENPIMRFNEIDKTIGDISQKMLSKTLRSLETDGFIERKVYPSVPPKVEYKLTEMGRDIIPYLWNLTNWAQGNLPQILENRKSNGVKCAVG